MKNVISRIIGVGIYGMIVGGWGGGGGGSSGSGEIPYRLIVSSSGGIWVVAGEAAVIGIQGNELSASAAEDSLEISTYGTVTVTDDGAYTVVSSDQELSIEAGDYLCSYDDLYSEFQDDGLVIYYGADATFSLEQISREELISHGGA
ncbi:MAG: hypothetical protein LUC83_08295 [Clostridiales bacterium]|nr:hypothetical protein [Clostridiales bacterium]